MNAIEHTLSVSVAPEVAYRAAATPEGIQGWWCADSDVATEVGGQTELRFVKDDRPVVMRFVVDALEPGRRVAWTCIANANPAWLGTTLTWSIEPAEDGSRIAFSHDGFASGGPPYDMTVQGWRHFMSSLEKFLDTGAGEPW